MEFNVRSSKKFFWLSIIATILFLALTAGCRKALEKEESVKSGPIPRSLRPSKVLEASPELITMGKEVYDQKCAPCHGLDGRGEGESAYLLYPRPRDFVNANYRLISTWEGLPTDEDIYFSISRGIPGSAMPSWAHLSEDVRWGLVHYLKSFAEDLMEVDTTESESGSGVIKVPPEPPYTPEAELSAKKLFLEGCASCHGETGRGDGVEKQFDSKGYPTRPRDLTRGIFKGSPEPEEVYRRIIAGMPGTPMPMNDWTYGDAAWHLTHYILSMSSPEQRERAEMRKFRIVANRVDQIPEHPDAGVWRDAPHVNLHLMPLWWRDDRPEILTVQALHDGKEIALRLMWEDETHDHSVIRPQDFRDGAALEFSLEDDPPFFAMGERNHFVNIWMWKSERQADLEPAFQDIDKVYPNLGIDSYPNLMRSPVEQPARHALTLESDPDFITGWGAKNIVSDPTRRSAVEDLSAQGFGTLKAHPVFDNEIQAKGVYDFGTYRVVFRRSLDGDSKNAVRFTPGEIISVAFAIWNGSAGDRDGKKSVTIWQELYVGR